MLTIYFISRNRSQVVTCHHVINIKVISEILCVNFCEVLEIPCVFYMYMYGPHPFRWATLRAQCLRQLVAAEVATALTCSEAEGVRAERGQERGRRAPSE